ncbi:hypothetical protein Adeg_1217 [Ammonifex degensii KC4]|uniref:YtxH domain-containing protein n=1 Tax=Ammonifex degensii (strain DSM 10501 / KC4) TaxID=429009 RepID=C9R7P9_AMMDK|nr:hypothetical protein [Ammonifex degensii]ACX52328.1 hypothetical protein Adeg_1217 [Ammonifex degensii KC4]
MTFWRGLVTGGIIGLVAGALLLPELGNERSPRQRLKTRRLDRMQRMIRGMARLAELVR